MADRGRRDQRHAFAAPRRVELSDLLHLAGVADPPDRDVLGADERTGQRELTAHRRRRRQLGEARIGGRVGVDLDEQRVLVEREVTARSGGQPVEQRLHREPLDRGRRDEPCREGDRA